MNTNNNVANYIATKRIAKHMDRSAAVKVWNDLKADGWRAEGCTMVKIIEKKEHRFSFERHGMKVKVSFIELEVTV
jgi:hypothetical protein